MLYQMHYFSGEMACNTTGEFQEPILNIYRKIIPPKVQGSQAISACPVVDREVSGGQRKHQAKLQMLAFEGWTDLGGNGEVEAVKVG